MTKEEQRLDREAGLTCAIGHGSRAAVRWLFGLWFACAALSGAILMSYHQPFRTPGEGILKMVGSKNSSGWTVVHFLSASCACSQKIMQHLLDRKMLSWAGEEIMLVDDGEPYLPHSEELVAALAGQGFAIRHVQADQLQRLFNLHGIPMLLMVSPQKRIAYIGGYGARASGEAGILLEVHAGSTQPPYPILGCAVGTRLQHTVDPFQLKYR